ncbi:imidazole glycerol phosphate synthase, glutamine amidotransferase subunit [Candidatus Endobugula sertula]|uniref:Imidazole glycerol phosphate synthase subunit HisH n=1 Tax=Candidatus Endobugula sertula TaxID=62101 RepID=A0A1D2QSK0_9GAMM|nr:imidazole glycerol phosphate synthase, glutamine amidotransferase subunit [Candidatus Endobugula sertula]
MTTSVAIIDYGMGNLHSVASAFAHVAPDSQIDITSDAQLIANADKVLFPGVGAIRDCMVEIRRLGFDTLVPEMIKGGKPMLAICVGMQALMASSEENSGVSCIDVLPGFVNYFGDDLRDDQGRKLKVPHMGWNQVQQTIDHPLWQGIDNYSHFYFVHSYFVIASNAQQVAGRTEYHREFVAALSHGSLFATQFHPEKSDTAGLQLLKNFMDWDGRI